MSSPSSGNTAKWQRCFGVSSALIAAIFWIWAVVNTAKSGSLDLGVVSFLTVLVVHVVLICRCCGSSPSSRCASYSVLGTHLFVTLNYLLGVYVAVGTDMIEEGRRTGFAIYCGIFTVLWLASAVVGCRIFRPVSPYVVGEESVLVGGTARRME